MVTAEITDVDNSVFELAANFITNTSKCVFLTGKAGTGKTTFLRHIRGTTGKNTVVVAPTGVAAINAGGVTIHSFFQLPFTPFVPPEEGSQGLFERSGFLRNLRIDSEKRTLLREMDLLIVDEVSMVRCDVLDAIDIVFRFFRRKENVPFGGVQVLLIGDLFQLPPVVQSGEWSILGQYYRSPFFFDARVMQETAPVYIELKKIYRQTDPLFIDLLNRIRNNQTTAGDLELLNSRFNPGFQPEAGKGFITLTTHNSRADKINHDSLQKLPEPELVYTGEVEGDFPERSYPTEKTLVLKKGAQIMFIKNDIGPVRRYYNGKIGTISDVGAGKILVQFPGEEGTLEVSKDSWRNVRYTFNPVSREVEEEVLGVFTQYPIRLAWAITIHKSQGLTFQHVIIDAGQSFAPGQVYVALSRCTSMEGIVLHSRIFRQAIRSDQHVLDFAEEEQPPDQLGPLLQQEKKHYRLSLLLDIFEWRVALEDVRMFGDFLAERKFIDREEADRVVAGIDTTLREFVDITNRFSDQLRSLAAQSDSAALIGRIDAGVSFFMRNIDERIIAPLRAFDDSMKSSRKVKKVRRKLKELIEIFESHKGYLGRANNLAAALDEE